MEACRRASIFASAHQELLQIDILKQNEQNQNKKKKASLFFFFSFVLSRLFVRGTVFGSFSFKKDNLRNSATDNKRNRHGQAVVGDFHGPTIDISDIAPSSALADLENCNKLKKYIDKK